MDYINSKCKERDIKLKFSFGHFFASQYTGVIRPIGLLK